MDSDLGGDAQLRVTEDVDLSECAALEEALAAVVATKASLRSGGRSKAGLTRLER